MIKQTNFSEKELGLLTKNKKILNLNIQNPLYIVFCFFTLGIGIYLDFMVFEEGTATIGYIPFMILSGVIIRNPFVLALISGLVGVIVTYGATGTFHPSVFLARWTSFFLISFVISTLIQNIHRERESLMVLATTLSQSLDARDEYTAFHSNNVAYYSFEIGKAMRLQKEDCLNLYLGGLFHDIGKIGIPEDVLNKPSRLTDEEYEIIKSHPQKGYDILKNVPYLKKNGILDMVLYHHEKFDGTGYPRQLERYNIPKVARIMAVADSFDAMTSKRVYRNDLDLEYAIGELKKGRGVQFDPEVIDVFLRLLKTKRIEIRGTLPAKQKKKIRKQEQPFVNAL